MDGLARAKFDALAADGNALPLQARKMHLDARAIPVEEGMVFEAGQIETGAELAVDAARMLRLNCAVTRCESL